MDRPFLVALSSSRMWWLLSLLFPEQVSAGESSSVLGAGWAAAKLPGLGVLGASRAGSSALVLGVSCCAPFQPSQQENLQYWTNLHQNLSITSSYLQAETPRGVLQGWDARGPS